MRAAYERRAVPSELPVDPQHWLGTSLKRDWAADRVLERMLMYERRIESSLYRTMAELQRLRLMRKLEAAEAEAGESDLGALVRRSRAILPAMRDDCAKQTQSAGEVKEQSACSLPAGASGSTGIPRLAGGRRVAASGMGVPPMNTEEGHGQDARGTHGRDGRATGGRDAHATITPDGITTNESPRSEGGTPSTRDRLCAKQSQLGEAAGSRQKGATPAPGQNKPNPHEPIKISRWAAWVQTSRRAKQSQIGKPGQVRQVPLQPIRQTG